MNNSIETINENQKDLIIQELKYSNDVIKQRAKIRENELLELLKEKDIENDKLKRRALIILEEEKKSATSRSNYESSLLEKCKNYEEELNNINTQLDQLRQQNQVLKATCDDLSYKIIDFDNERSNFQKMIKNLNSEIKKLKELNSELNIENQYLKSSRSRSSSPLPFYLKSNNNSISNQNDNDKVNGNVLITELLSSSSVKLSTCVKSNNIPNKITINDEIIQEILQPLIKGTDLIFDNFKNNINLKLDEIKSSYTQVSNYFQNLEYQCQLKKQQEQKFTKVMPVITVKINKNVEINDKENYEPSEMMLEKQPPFTLKERNVSKKKSKAIYQDSNDKVDHPNSKILTENNSKNTKTPRKTKLPIVSPQTASKTSKRRKGIKSIPINIQQDQNFNKFTLSNVISDCNDISIDPSSNKIVNNKSKSEGVKPKSSKPKIKPVKKIIKVDYLKLNNSSEFITNIGEQNQNNPTDTNLEIKKKRNLRTRKNIVYTEE